MPKNPLFSFFHIYLWLAWNVLRSSWTLCYQHFTCDNLSNSLRISNKTFRKYVGRVTLLNFSLALWFKCSSSLFNCFIRNDIISHISKYLQTPCLGFADSGDFYECDVSKGGLCVRLFVNSPASNCTWSLNVRYIDVITFFSIFPLPTVPV